MMVKQVKVSNFTEVKGIVSAAAKCYNDVGVHDMIVCENEHDLNSVVNALKQ